MDLGSLWNDIIAVLDKGPRSYEIWLCGGRVVEMEGSFEDFLKRLQEIFGRDVLADNHRYRQLFKSDDRHFPIPLHKRLIFVPAPHKKGMIYLVWEHCIMYESVHQRRGVSRIYLSDLQVVEVLVPPENLRETFAAADKVKRRMRHLYLVPRKRDDRMEEAAGTYAAEAAGGISHRL